jgi:hypothetical protein
MTFGGNQALAHWFKKFCILQSAPISYKYRTKAAYQYREMLAAKAHGKKYDKPEIDPDEAFDTVNISPYDQPAFWESFAIQNETVKQIESRAMSIMDKITSKVESSVKATG